MRRFRTASLLLLGLVLFCFLCLMRFDGIHGQDEISHYMKLTRQLYHDWYTHPDSLAVFSPHLYPLCAWGVSTVFGAVNSFTLRLTNLLLWLGVLLMLFRTVPRETRLPALLAGLLLPLAVAAVTIVEIDQGILPLTTFLLVTAAEGLTERPQPWRAGLLALAFCLALWCRLSTPLVLLPLFIAYAWLRGRSWRLPALTAAALLIGGLLFYGSWRLYGELTGVNWPGAFEYLTRSFSETTGGQRATTVASLAQTVLYAFLWGLPPGYLLLLAIVCLRQGREGLRNWRQPLPPCLHLLAGLWLLAGYTVVGGALFGFPKYQTPAFPLLIAGVAIAWPRLQISTGTADTMTPARQRRLLAAFGVIAMLIAWAVLEDLLLLVRLDTRACQALGNSPAAPLTGLVSRLIIGHGLIIGAMILARRRFQLPLTALALIAGLAVNAALLIRQSSADYNCGYMYGDRGETRSVVALLNDHGLKPEHSLLPMEVLNECGQDELTYPFPFFIDNLDETREAILHTRPEAIAVSYLAYPVSSFRAFCADSGLSEQLENEYQCVVIGHYRVWYRRDSASPLSPTTDQTNRNTP